MSWTPWPGHPCENHGCDGCAICRSGRCCCDPDAGGNAHRAQAPAVHHQHVLHSAITEEAAATQRPNLTTVVHVEALLRGAEPVANPIIEEVRAAAQRHLTERSEP